MSGPKSVEERILSSLSAGELSSAELAVAIGQHSLSGKRDLATERAVAYV